MHMEMINKKKNHHKESEQTEKHAISPESMNNKSEKQNGLAEIESIFLEKKKGAVKSGESVKKRRRIGNSNSLQQSERETVKDSMHNSLSGDWVDDGLGGKYNSEGFTGRRLDGMKIFKAHVLNRPNAGISKDCPFDCQCCFI